jgi:hypothetical protein
MYRLYKIIRVTLLAALVTSLSGCNDPHIYGSIGISSGYGGYGHGGWNSGISTSISVGGRIH